MNRTLMPKKMLQNNWPSWYELNTDAQEECYRITDHHDMNRTLMPKMMLQNNWPSWYEQNTDAQEEWQSWYEWNTDAQEDVTE